MSSTLLYEAAALGCRVFVLDCTAARLETPATFGRWFATAQELWDAIHAGEPRAHALPPAELFANHWSERYRAFLSSCGAAAT